MPFFQGFAQPKYRWLRSEREPNQACPTVKAQNSVITTCSHNRVLRVLHRVLGVLHRVLGVLHRVLGGLHRVLGVLHRVLGI